MDNKEKFLQAIQEKKIVELTFNAEDKWVIIRRCIPFDFWPSRRKLSVNPDRYHFYDLNSPDGRHTLSILPEQVINIDILDETFNPWDYVTRTPNWFTDRNRGIYS